MSDFIFRTEEMTNEQIQEFYVENTDDIATVQKLSSRNPVLLVGSRGVGKTFLFRVAQSKLLENFSTKKILPVYITFRKASVIQVKRPIQFQSWMLSRICSNIIKELRKTGFDVRRSYGTKLLLGESKDGSESKIEAIATQFESSWRTPEAEIDETAIPSLDDFMDAVEDICLSFDLKRIILFIDEAAHVFYPEQQRQFFTLFRDLRSAYIKCNAAVYPGVTVYGETFEPEQDAEVIYLNRKIEDADYIENMKAIVLKQVSDSSQAKVLSQQGEHFSILAYSAGGNPRHLLKTVARAGKMDSSSVNTIIRTYYRETIWAEHSGLAEKYTGYRDLITWGRDFVEKEVIPSIKAKNDSYLAEEKPTSVYFWIDRNAPQKVKEALRILEYSGIVYEHSKGIRATRDGIGTRYAINVGCLLSAESTPLNIGLNIVRRITIKRMTEFGANYKSYDLLPDIQEVDMTNVLREHLKLDIGYLDLTPWQIDKIRSVSINTIGELLGADESALMKASYIAGKRARSIKNAAYAAVYEFLLG